MADSVLDLLSNSRLCAAISDALKEVYSYAGTLYDNPQDDMVGIAHADLWHEAWWRARVFADGPIEPAFREHLFDKMLRPRRVTPPEISDTFWGMAAPLQHRSPDYDSAYAAGVYAAFLNFVSNCLLSGKDSPPFIVGRIPPSNGNSYTDHPNWISCTPGEIPDDPSQWVDESDFDAERLLEEESVWHTDGVCIRLVGNSPCTDMARWNDEFAYLNMAVRGSMSHQAMEDLTTELVRTMPSIIRSVVATRQMPMLSISTVLVPCQRRLPVVTTALLGKNIHFVRRCLDAFFSRPTKKDSLDRRIHNAVSLLVESDTQLNDAVGLALSIAAVEALLGEKGREIDERLSGSLAVLLEPDPGMRAQARKFFKRLYGFRSDALHGQQLDSESHCRDDARCVAAAVLQSVVSREDFLRRSGFQPEQPNELLRSLEDLHWSTGQPMGVSVLPITGLWRAPADNPHARPQD
jgi:hypothetical protein